MNWQFTPYTPFLLITAAACLTLTAIVFRRHRTTSTLVTTLLPGVSGEGCPSGETRTVLNSGLMTGWSLAPTDPRLASFDLALQKLFDAREAEAMILRAIEMEAQTGKPETPDSIMSDS